MANAALVKHMGFESMMQKVELHKLIYLMVDKELISQADGITFFTELAQFCREPDMDAYSEFAPTRALHYEDMASLISGGDFLSRDPTK